MSSFDIMWLWGMATIRYKMGHLVYDTFPKPAKSTLCDLEIIDNERLTECFTWWPKRRSSGHRDMAHFVSNRCHTPISAAETAAKQGDKKKVLQHLKEAGKWVFQVATKIGEDVAAKAITTAMGLPEG